jgi:6-phosphogluconolactonase/glucosamine-6-phosphate isomerase/deaminase
MNYRYTKTPEPVIKYLVETLTAHLEAGERVLWLVSGGSCIQTTVTVAKWLSAISTDKLAFSLVDERYGPVGHPDENWQQLLDAGFALDDAHLYRPLSGTNRTETTRTFNDWLSNEFGQSDYVIALMGIGADGHTSGIKPNSPAVTAAHWATDYQSEDYERITTTFDAIRRFDEVVIQAIGPDKAETVKNLIHHDISLAEQPAQVLKQVKQSTLYTDHKEEL